jgi:ArsR family transcriptional regulator, lead/cadmium/zinc/bismuth-responsive transcriptional repressor
MELLLADPWCSLQHLNSSSDDRGVQMAEAKVVDIDGCEVTAVDPDKVVAAAERLPSQGEVGRLTELFKLLGDPTRLRILSALVEVGELCVCDLSAVVGAPETSVSHALRLLRMAGVVRARREGRMAYYAVEDHHVRLVLDLAAEHLRHEVGR